MIEMIFLLNTFSLEKVTQRVNGPQTDYRMKNETFWEIGENFEVSKMKKIVAGKKLWNYDNLEPTEKKGAI